MKARKIKVLATFIALGGVLLGYQNCGANKNSLDASAQLANDSRPVDIIDVNTTGDIRFAETKAVVTAAQTDFHASGICSAEQNGALLNWKVLDEQDEVVAEGKALCDGGVFSVDIADANDISCGAQLKLEAALGAKAKAELPISKNCN